MLKTIRADIYRLKRGRGLYITFGVLLALILLIVLTSEAGTIGIQIEDAEHTVGSPAQEDVVFNGINIAEILYTGADNVVWFLLPLLVIVAGPMFSYNTIKNELSNGMSRTKLYLSKLVLSSLLCILAYAFFIASGILVATLVRGYGGTPPEGYWANILKICGAQLVPMLALNSVGIFLMFTTRRTAAVNGAYIAFCLVPTIILMIISTSNSDLLKLYDYDLVNIVKKFGYMNVLETADLVKGFAAAAFWLIVPTISGIALFKRSEVK